MEDTFSGEPMASEMEKFETSEAEELSTASSNNKIRLSESTTMALIREGCSESGFSSSTEFFLPGVPPSEDILAAQFPIPVLGLAGSIISRLQPPDAFKSLSNHLLS